MTQFVRIACLSETENVFYYVENKFDLAADTRLLMLHIIKPASTFALRPCIFSVRLLLVCAELDLGKMLVILDLWMVFK